MTATLNGFRRSYVRFVTAGKDPDAAPSLRGDIEGYGCDGYFYFTLPSLAPGTYRCPDVGIRWFNQHAGPLEFNNAATADCCTIEITRSGGPGEFIEGTFSGIMINDALRSWIKIENGHFAVINDRPR
jgi:hypothetical protein